MNRNIQYTFEQLGNVGVFKLGGELIMENEDELKLILMRAIHDNDRAVLNLKKVTRVDRHCMNLLKKGYSTSLWLKRPIIVTEVPSQCMEGIDDFDMPHETKSDWSAGQKDKRA